MRMEIPNYKDIFYLKKRGKVVIGLVTGFQAIPNLNDGWTYYVDIFIPYYQTSQRFCYPQDVGTILFYKDSDALRA